MTAILGEETRETYCEYVTLSQGKTVIVPMGAAVTPELPNILVVDREESSARGLANLLRDDGYHPDVVADGATAIARLTLLPPPACLIADLATSKVNGAVLAQLARLRSPKIPIVIIAAHPELASRLVNGLEPPLIIFSKPLHYPELIGFLQQHVQLATKKSGVI